MRIHPLKPAQKILSSFLPAVFLLGVFVSEAFAGLPPSPNAEVFYPISADVRQRVDFWKDIFTKYSVHTAVLHDRMYVQIVYESVDIASILRTTKYSNRAKYRVIDEYRTKYEKILTVLHQRNGNTDGLGEDYKRVAALFNGIPGRNKYLEAGQGIRAQFGIRDKFIEGLHRQEKYIQRLRQIFREEGVPEEILALPHVESSFNPRARSRVGAVGMWQFTRSTGRRYMRINGSEDQRLDPYHSSRAAAKHMKYNYAKLRSWPLAIMAYNHGTGGILRAQRSLGTSNPEEIIKRYSSRSFQFASRNFYPEFLAALEASLTPWAYIPLNELPESLRQKSGKDAPLLAVNPEPVRIESGPAERQAPPVADVKAGQPVIPEKTSDVSETLVDLPKPAPKATQAVTEAKDGPGKEGLLSRIDNMLITEVNAMDATQEPGLAVKPHASGDYFWIQAYPGESIWNYAEWSGVPAGKLRSANKISRRGDVRLGMSVNIPRPVAHSTEFERKRRDYHKSIENAYFAKYAINGTIEHRIANGENLWYLCNNKYNIPIWLFQKYNRLNPLKNLKIGEVVIIPVVTEAS